MWADEELFCMYFYQVCDMLHLIILDSVWGLVTLYVISSHSRTWKAYQIKSNFGWGQEKAVSGTEKNQMEEHVAPNKDNRHPVSIMIG